MTWLRKSFSRMSYLTRIICIYEVQDLTWQNQLRVQGRVPRLGLSRVGRVIFGGVLGGGLRQQPVDGLSLGDGFEESHFA